jgi:hypothetical protein
MRSRLLALGVFAAGALGLLVERLVVTDREAIRALVADTEAALSRADFEAFAGALHPDFAGPEGDREQTVAFVRSLWSEYAPTGLSVDLGEIALGPDGEAEAKVVATAAVLARPVRAHVTMAFAKHGGAWKVVRVRYDEPVLR